MSETKPSEPAIPASPALPGELAPARYIERVHLASGEVIEEEIHPEELLVHSHRDYHPVETHAQYMMSRLVRATGSRRIAMRKLRQMRMLARRIAGVVARLARRDDPEKVSAVLFGVKGKEHFFRFRRHQLEPEEIEARLAALRRETALRLAAASLDGRPRLRVLLTGGTGFIGKELLWQAAHDETIEEVVVLIRPREVRDRDTGEVTRVVTAAERGERLLRQLWLDAPERRGKFHFLAGDIEKPNLGICDDDLAGLASRVTHVIHCAASVAFDDLYESSFRTNVFGAINALRFSETLQSAAGSVFVAHVAIETSYIHGRQVYALARESDISFPRNYYNNYYELTKAMASIEAERFMLASGLRLTQLCPSIVIGEAASGNNRGDTKVVNAPVNLFGRTFQTLNTTRGGWVDRSKASMLARLACFFPGDPSAQINLITVDRVAAGILAALKRPEAVGERIHLANDRRITPEQMARITGEELGVKVKLTEPTLHRTVALPLLSRVLKRFKQERIAQMIQKMTDVFGGYSEWGQPIHEVGNDVRVLGLPAERPDAEDAFRMLCRHNRWVQGFGKVKDLDELSRRERIWREFLRELEARTGEPPCRLEPARFAAEVARGLSFAKG